MYTVAERRNFSILTALWSHITMIWVAWLATQEPSGYLSSEFPAIYHVYCHTIHLLQSAINISEEVTILDIVQMLVSDQEGLGVNHTFSVLQNLYSLFHWKAQFWHSGDFFFTILQIFPCKHALLKGERDVIIDRKYGTSHVFTTSQKNRHCSCRFTMSRFQSWWQSLVARDTELDMEHMA